MEIKMYSYNTQYGNCQMLYSKLLNGESLSINSPFVVDLLRFMIF